MCCATTQGSPFFAGRLGMLAAIAAVLGCGNAAGAQPALNSGRFELSENVTVDQADNAVQVQLDRVKVHVAEKQWNEAVQMLREVMENHGRKLLAVTPRRFVSVSDYCQLRLAALPPEALAIYRRRVDPSAMRWYREGVERRDRGRLLEVVEQALASSWGDNALMALGEMALESGDYAGARAFWEKIIPAPPPHDGIPTWLSVPETELDLAAVRARLVLASILEGSLDRAAKELEAMSRLDAGARGNLAGQQVNFVDALRTLLAESRSWPATAVPDNWTTFAGDPRRGKIAPRAVEPNRVVWRRPLRPTLPANRPTAEPQSSAFRVAEKAVSPLSYHPLITDGLALVNNQVEILAIDLATGRPAWGHDSPEIYRDQLDETARELFLPINNLGVPRFTMTAHQGKLYARMGASTTGYPRETVLRGGTGYLVCLDLEAEGRLLWRIDPEEPGLAFEGSPLTDGARVFVAVRRGDIQPQTHVACYSAEDGRLLWRQFVCQAETPARGMYHETSHNLLTLHRDTLYVNTNMGAVAALSTDGGRVRWVAIYPRQRQGDLQRPAAHWSRDLNPCLFDRGRLYVAPSDSPRIFCLEAATGQILWQTSTELGEAVHLLGVAGSALIASGPKLYWIGIDDDAGRVRQVWPDGHEKLGHGRGVVAENRVYWPARDKVYVFDANTAGQVRLYDLVPHDARGGNLVMAGGRLLVATPDELVAFAADAGPAIPEEKPLTMTAR